MSPFEKKLSAPMKLPVLSKDIHVLMQALNGDSLSNTQLAEVIKHYPVITARLLYLANSAWSAPIQPITCIEQACTRLGSSMVKSISIALSIASSFDAHKCPAFCTLHYWTTSMLVSEGAGLLAAQFNPNKQYEDFEHTAQTAGILHNLGLLWLAENLAEETSLALQHANENPQLSISSALTEYAGVNYCRAGAWLGKQLKLPETLVSVIQNHHSHDYQGSEWELSLIVGSAANMVSALYQQSETITFSEKLESSGIDSVMQEKVFQRLNKNFSKTQELVETLF